MQNIFENLLEASMQGSVVILAVIVLRLVLKKAPRSTFCLLWLLAGLRLLLPFEIESNLSLQPQIQKSELSIQAEQPVQVPDILIQNPDGQPLDVPDASTQIPSLPEGNWENVQSESFLYEVEDGVIRPITFGDIAVYGWLLGMGIMVLASAWSYWKLKKQVREAILTDDGCWECPGLETAFVLGFMPPKIYLPRGLAPEERAFIFDHENTHIARHDHWWKLLGYVVLSIHWFNPLVWLGYSLLCRDIELACDEHVVRYMSVEQRKAYSSALLGCSSRHMSIAACPVAFGESNPKQRILNVLNYKRPTFWISLTAVIAVIFVVVCLMTSPKSDSLLTVWNIPSGKIDAALLYSGNRLVDISSEDDMKELTDILESVICDPDVPTEIPAEDEGHGLVFTDLDTDESGYTLLNFSADCTLVWSDGDVAYPVTEPEILLRYFTAISEGVRDRETSGEPFATIDQPLEWLSGISLEAVSRAEIYRQFASVREDDALYTSSTNGIYAAREFDDLLSVLNSLPKDAIVSEKKLEKETFLRLFAEFGSSGGMSVTIHDDVNGLVVMLRLLADDTIQLVMIDELEKVEEGNLYLDHPQCWILEDKALLDYLKELQEELPIITYMVTREQALLRDCQVALSSFQNRMYYGIRIDNSFNGDALNSGSTQFYYGWGDDWLRYSVTGSADFCDEEWYLYKTGQKYSRYLYTVYQPENGEGYDTGWVKGFQRGEGQVGEPWLKTFQWVDKDITFVEERTEGDYHLITISVQGSPYDDALTNVSQYQVTFVFDADDKLCQVLKNYTETYEMVSNGQEDIGINQVNTTIQILDDTNEEIVDTLQKYIEEAMGAPDIS